MEKKKGFLSGLLGSKKSNGGCCNMEIVEEKAPSSCCDMQIVEEASCTCGTSEEKKSPASSSGCCGSK